MSIRWSLLPSLVSTPRSSHTAAVTHAGRLLLYSGELRPRTPVDAALHVLNLRGPTPPAPWRALGPSPALSATPEPRVGATAVYDPLSNSLYVWGGRGGVDMAPLGRFQAGVWKAPLDGLDSADAILWERLPAVNDDDSDVSPALRSFHASVLVEGKLYVHAGCPASSRLASLHAYDLATHTWHKLADAPDQPRGGTALAAVSLPSNPAPVLIRFGGFAGVQLPQVPHGTPPPLDVYTPITDTWTTVYPAPDPDHGFPGPRSVHGLIPFSTNTQSDSSASAPFPVALLHHGESSASTLGHAGAGVFWDDAWLLLAADPSSWQWKKLRVEGDVAPEPRGWFSSAGDVSGGKTRVVLTGGLLSSNERSDQVWIGDIDI